MAFKDPVREREYQKVYQQNYKKKLLTQLKDELKYLSQQHDIEIYINDFILIYNDIDELTSTDQQIYWYRFLLKYIRYQLVWVVVVYRLIFLKNNFRDAVPPGGKKVDWNYQEYLAKKLLFGFH